MAALATALRTADLRPATVADIPILLDLIHRAFAEYQGRLDPPSGAPRESAASLQKLFDMGEQAVLAVDGADPVGCAFLSHHGVEMYVHRLAVAPTRRKQGIGRALMAYAHARALAAACTYVRVGVRLALPENIAFYERLGYRILCEACHPGYSRPTFVHMVLELIENDARRVEVVPYDLAWPARYAAEAAALRRRLGDNVVAIHHIGSTAIPGLAAKPIIDIMPVVRDLGEVDARIQQMAELGYTPRGEYGLPGRRYFFKGSPAHHTHHVHVYQEGNPEINRHLALRDYLRVHSLKAAAYGELKQSLAARYPANVEAYIAEKDGLVRALEAEALDWYHVQGRRGEMRKVEIVIDAMLPTDWPRVHAIYEEGIATGHATFEQAAPDWQSWDAKHLPTCRLVARRDGEVVGWTALSPVSARAVYAGVAEESIYIAAAFRGQGIGRQLLQALISAAEAAGIWTLQTGIFPENTASVALHQACGFRIVGRRERIGQMHGVWRDVLLMERRSQTVGV